LLHNFYNVSHRIETNLWPVFERDIFPFITVDDDVFSDKIKRIKEAFWKTSSGRFISGGKFAIANGDLDKLNSEIDSFLQQIENTANEFIKKHFYSGQEKLKIHLEYKRKLNFDQIKNEKKKNKKPDLQIKLWVELKEDNSDSWKTIQRPHSFLHESFLSRIAFAIRIGALRLRPSTDKSFQILVLDDMLISLDMSNRMQLIKVLLNRDNSSDVEYFDNFQKIIMTHDKGFYEIIKRYTNPLEWEYFDFRKDENTNNAPVVTIDKSHIEKARAYLSDGQYELCGSELRKEAEGILSKFLKGLNNEYESEFKPLASKLNSALNKVIEDERGRFRKIFVDRDLSINILKKLVSTVFFKR